MNKGFADFNDNKSQLLNHFVRCGFCGWDGDIVRGRCNDLIRYSFFGGGFVRDGFIRVRSFAPDKREHEHTEAQEGKKLFHSEKK